MKALENQDIVCIAGVDFEPLWARTQQLLLRLPTSNRILYVETPLSFLSPFKDASLWPKWLLWLKGLRTYRSNIFLYSPPLLLPFGNRWRVVNRLNQRILALFLRRACRQAGFNNPLLLTYLPNTVDMIGRLKEKLLVYDCVDEHAAFQGFNADMVTQMEAELLAASDLVFATARPLLEDKQAFASEIFLLRNAAEVDLFGRTLAEDTAIPEDVTSLQGPVLGFIGRIKEWIDLDLIRETALARPSWSFVMVGPVELDVDISSFEDIKNVHFLGSRDREVLPGYLKKFDVCLNPFRPSRLSRAVNPLKFYEYLASGKPIVSTPMPEMEALQDYVEIGAGRKGFIAAVERALQDTPEKSKSRLLFSQEQSWEKRAREFGHRIQEALE